MHLVGGLRLCRRDRPERVEPRRGHAARDDHEAVEVEATIPADVEGDEADRSTCDVKHELQQIERQPPVQRLCDRTIIAAFMAEVAAISAAPVDAASAGPLTVARYIDGWVKDREQCGKASAAAERQRLEKYVKPSMGSLLLAEVTPLQVRDFVRELRANRGRAARTQIHVYRTLKQMFKSARIEGLITVNPCELEHGELPAKRDADPEWRSQATYTVREVEQLISDVEIPVERRLMYALKAIAGLRHGELRPCAGATLTTAPSRSHGSISFRRGTRATRRSRARRAATRGLYRCTQRSRPFSRPRSWSTGSGSTVASRRKMILSSRRERSRACPVRTPAKE